MHNQSKPQQGKARSNPQEVISGNFQSEERSELAPKVSNSKVPAGQFQRRSKLTPTGNISEAPTKAKRNPQEGISENFYFQGRSELAPKGSNSEVPGGQFLRSLQLLRRSELAPKGMNSEVPAGEFCANRV